MTRPNMEIETPHGLVSQITTSRFIYKVLYSILLEFPYFLTIVFSINESIFPILQPLSYRFLIVGIHPNLCIPPHQSFLHPLEYSTKDMSMDIQDQSGLCKTLYIWFISTPTIYTSHYQREALYRHFLKHLKWEKRVSIKHERKGKATEYLRKHRPSSTCMTVNAKLLNVMLDEIKIRRQMENTVQTSRMLHYLANGKQATVYAQRQSLDIPEHI